ncbi:MAG TPA: DUF2339 domain-containing protein, partial [Aestuariivirga sp.]|nr:DUF2339 domain-containing protein [Aestuariivirga sp.]
MDGVGLLVAVVGFVLALIALNKISALQTRIHRLTGELDEAKEMLGRLVRDLAQSPHAGAPDTVVRQMEETPPPEPAEPAVPAHEAVIPEPEAEREAIERQISEQVSTWASAASAEREVSKPEEQREPAPAAERFETAPAAGPPEFSPPPAPPPAPARRGDMEQALASRWFVWIGGIAIAIGGLLFVKYAYDNNLIPPSVQIILGLIAAAALVGAGEFARRKSADVNGPNYVPAALSAAGLVTTFGSIYAAYALYELISPTPAFVGLAAVALGALALSRLQGPLIAALGLLGSYATPTLIPSEHPSAWNFFPYLLVIHAASFMVLRGRIWWWLGYAAIAGSTAWALLWLVGKPFEPQDVWPIGLFAHAIGLISFFAISGVASLRNDDRNLTAPPLLIGLVGLAAETLILG